MRIPITVTETGGIARSREMVELGLPLPMGLAGPDASPVVLDETDNPLLSQFKTLATYEDGTLRAAHGLFLIDLQPRQTRALTVVSEKTLRRDCLLCEDSGAFRVATGAMRATFNGLGQLTGFQLDGVEMLDASAGPSLQLELMLGPAGESISSSPRSAVLTARIKETGPVRSILNVQGNVTLRDRRGDCVFRVDCDWVFHSGKSEIHLHPMLVGAVTEAVLLGDWSLKLHLRNGGRLIYGGSPPLIRNDPNHENMTWRGLKDGWVSWTLAGGAQLTAWSPDFRRHQNGMTRASVRDKDRKCLTAQFSRVEPRWGYQDVSNPAKPILVNRGSWRRWEAVFGFHAPEAAPRDLVRGWESPLRAFPAPAHYALALDPWLEGVSRPTRLRRKLLAKCEEFICKEPEYTGSIHGGWDGPNNAYIERSVSRGDFGEYLFHEFFRTLDRRCYRMAFDFGRIYRDTSCFTIAEASAGPHELGAARARSNEFAACSIRSYRGAVLLAYMHQETGDERYLDALRKRADFHLANYPHSIGRVSMSARDSAFLGKYLKRPELIAKAVEVAAHSLNKHFDPLHGFYENYDESQTLPDGRCPARSFPVGQWVMRDFLHTSNASPEMTAYNIIGWHGLYRLHDVEPSMKTAIRKVCEWFRDRQNEDGSWPYPHDTSATRWGHGCLQDAMAMLCACKMFGDRSFLESARRSIVFTEQTFAKFSRIPLLLGLIPHEQTEDSLTYYYGIETLALYNEIAEKEGLQ